MTTKTIYVNGSITRAIIMYMLCRKCDGTSYENAYTSISQIPKHIKEDIIIKVYNLFNCRVVGFYGPGSLTIQAGGE